MNNKIKLMLLLSFTCLLRAMEASSDNEYNPFSDGNPRIGEFVGIKNSDSTWNSWYPPLIIGYTEHEESWTTPKGRVIKRSDLGKSYDSNNSNDQQHLAWFIANLDSLEENLESQRNLNLKSFKTANDLRAHCFKQKKGSLEKESEK